MRRTIVDRFLGGDEYDPRKVDAEVDAWHAADADLALHAWLGVTAEEYALYVQHPQAMWIVLAARRWNISLESLLRSGRAPADLAVRGASPGEIRALDEWLKGMGRP